MGEAWTCACTLHVSDRMGNRCVAGGAPILVDVDSSEVETRMHDNENGSYKLEWRGKIAGAYKTQVRATAGPPSPSPTLLRPFL